MIKQDKKPHSSTRQLELLRHYFPVDDEHRIITFPLSYDSVWDVLADDVSTPEHPFVQDDIPERMGQLIRETPLDYKANFHFEIDDYDGYEPEAILNALNDAIELNHYHSNRDHSKKWFVAVALMVIGIIVLFLMFAGSVNGWYGEGQTKEIVVEVIDIFAWVLIWESVSILFLEPSQTRALDIVLKTRVDEIGFYDAKDHTTCYVKQKQSSVLKNWENDSRVKRVGMNFLLFSGGALIAFSFINFVASILHVTGPQIGEDGNPFYLSAGVMALWIGLSLLSSAFYFLAGLSAVSVYIGRGSIAKATPFFASLALISVVYNVVYGIWQNHASYSWANGFMFVVLAFYVVGYFMLRAGKQK
ncbi:MAG: hypothetical protein PUC66_00915 [Erysipelotrichaceae bacterium]|nr:hypothetical protein [Erysipelotrichaceae bacterium]